MTVMITGSRGAQKCRFSMADGIGRVNYPMRKRVPQPANRNPGFGALLAAFQTFRIAVRPATVRPIRSVLIGESVSSMNAQSDSHGSSTGEVVARSVDNSSGCGAPVRMAVVGLDRSGLFHVQRLALRSEFEVVAACDTTASGLLRLPGSHAADRPIYSGVDQLLSHEGYDTVLLAGPIERRVELGLQALNAGKHVALDSPPTVNAVQMRELVNAARRTGRRLSVVPSRRGGVEFRTALEIVRDDRLGSLYSARLLSWGKVVPDAGETPGPDSPARNVPADAFAFFAYQYVDQLLQLIDGRPCSVFGRILGPDEASSTVFTLLIDFENGRDALIDVNLESGAVLQTGWMLAGARGGYSGGRIYLEEASGEIADAPVSQSDLPEVDVYAELLDSAAERGPTPSAHNAEVVMRVIDAARESSRTGQCVSIDA
jgi:predicted dehydrogenase